VHVHSKALGSQHVKQSAHQTRNSFCSISVSLQLSARMRHWHRYFRQSSQRRAVRINQAVGSGPRHTELATEILMCSGLSVSLHARAQNISGISTINKECMNKAWAPVHKTEHAAEIMHDVWHPFYEPAGTCAQRKALSTS
jgi:hypothetical protein